MDQNIGGSFASVWFLILVLYIQCALVAGISQIGLRFLTVVSVHCLEVDGTWMNSFFVNLIIFLCCGFSLVLFVCSNMPKFTANTYVSGLFYVNVRQVSSLAWAFKYRVFEILIVVTSCIIKAMAGISFLVIYIIRRCCGAPKDENQAKLDQAQTELKELKKKAAK